MSIKEPHNIRKNKNKNTGENNYKEYKVELEFEKSFL